MVAGLYKDNRVNNINLYTKVYMGLTVGSMVEHCSLMPGIVMGIEGDDINIRRLDVDEYSGLGFSTCSLKNCGTRKLTTEQALKRLTLGKDVLERLYDEATTSEEYEAKIKESYEATHKSANTKG